MIINPKVIKKVESSVQLPEYMSAKNFTFNGNACIGYVGDNTLPEIIIPKSYSTVTSIETVAGAKVLDKENLSTAIYDFQSITFSDGDNKTHTYFSRPELDMLATDFPNDCYLVSMEVSEIFNFDFLLQSYDMNILQFPVIINGQSFSNGETAFNYITENNITSINFSGDVEVTKFVDGNDYKVTQVSSIEPEVSGFKNYENRIILLSNITTIGAWAFHDCVNLTSIEIPNSVTNIGVQVFMNCINLINIVLPEGITEITIHEFRSCRSLKSITIPSSVTSIYGWAFYGCSSLITMRVEATTPPTLQNTNAISSATTQIQVPAASVNAYKTATNWSNFADIIVGYTE